MLSIMEKPKCATDGCDRPAKVKGRCQPHYVSEWKKAKHREGLLPLVCEGCGAEYMPERRYADGSPKVNRFCSRRCKDKNRVMTPAERAEMLRRYYETKYGLTMEQVAELRSKGCIICGRTEASGRWDGVLHIDHCHETGRVRGALCHSCNIALGHFNHDPALLRKAAMYLQSAQIDYTP